ncbi:uncharacterized protein LOC116209640 isoform X2 [Punica granatum]|uniref:Uncharacterized protein LOC116209640 isoform X2 n=1 Tax=Punica granatum TaxID=22663 RepID=A0A6P8E152_PUNGR|nr:uncharacterized protein LOC116209640 isoform X2 [Punica granatum]
MASLEYPGHEHALIRQEISENCRVACSMCSQDIRGTAYCCQEHCDFFLDESCASVEFPPQIKHPSHPQHSLSLTLTPGKPWYDYNCGDCSFSLEAKFAMATLSTPQDELREGEEDVIEHISHEHPLTSFHVNIPNWAMCKGCWLRISGRVYGCRCCGFLLHESCARAPRVILQHPFHPQHSLTIVFDCDIRCKVCELHISGEVYCCPECIFFLHKLCADELPQVIAHYLHPEHPLTYQGECQYRGGTFYCNCCSREYTDMPSFRCESCYFDLDPKCALQTHSAIQEGVATTIQHFIHDHPLTLYYFKPTNYYKPMKNLVFHCEACRQPMTTDGLAYCCLVCDKNNGDRFLLHQSCAHLPSGLEHPFHPQHQLKLLPRAPSAEHFYCSACHERSQGFTFYCAECEFHLDLVCASLKPTLEHHRHEHNLTYFQRSPYKYPSCNFCRRSSRIDVYCCLPCNFNLHHKCLPLPPVIEHECHPYHPLVLFSKFVLGDPNDQYCDFCEEIRNPDHGVYRCDQCWYTTHIDCVISMSEVEGNISTQFEDRRLTKLNEEIASLEETIKVMETNLEALTENLDALKVRKKRDF